MQVCTITHSLPGVVRTAPFSLSTTDGMAPSIATKTPDDVCCLSPCPVLPSVSLASSTAIFKLFFATLLNCCSASSPFILSSLPVLVNVDAFPVLLNVRLFSLLPCNFHSAFHRSYEPLEVLKSFPWLLLLKVVWSSPCLSSWVLRRQPWLSVRSTKSPLLALLGISRPLLYKHANMIQIRATHVDASSSVSCCF